MIKFLSCAAVVGLVATSSSAFAGGHGFGGMHTMGASSFSPGRQFVTSGPTGRYPGASGYAPGRQYVEDRNESPSAREIDRDPTATGPGASVYAPGFFRH